MKLHTFGFPFCDIIAYTILRSATDIKLFVVEGQQNPLPLEKKKEQAAADAAVTRMIQRRGRVVR